MIGERTSEMRERALRVLPGGITAGARANRALGRPFYVERAEGPFVYDPDGKRYVDTCTSNGAALLGHGHPAEAVRRAAEMGFACAYDGVAQVSLAERLVEGVPSFEMVRFTTTGTEATFYAVRTARAYTGKTKVLKFEGHFHGYNDPLAFSMWPDPGASGPAERPEPQPETDGLPPEALREIVVAPFNDAEAFRRVLDEHGDDLAAVILEPINYDAGVISPDGGFLALVREETEKRGIVLIFDEVLSGYRTGPDCAQGYLGVVPDLSVLGKAIGGGVPLSVFGGKRELMSLVAPLGRAVHTGTYNAHLVPILAAHAFLDAIAEDGFYGRLIGQHERLEGGLRRAFGEAGLPVRVQGVGARFGMHFGSDPDEEITGWRQAAKLDWGAMDAFCREMDRRGVYVNPAWHHGISAMHDEETVDRVVEAAFDSAAAVVRDHR